MIYFDLDGVIRSLTAVTLGFEPPTWDFIFNGMGIVDILNKNKTLLIKAPPTIYFDVITELPEITIITCQPKTWIPYTEEWIKNYFNNGCKVNTIYVDHPKFKLGILKEGDLLIEDYPFFHDYSRVVVIDRPYNSNVKECFKRIRTKEELKEIIMGNTY